MWSMSKWVTTMWRTSSRVKPRRSTWRSAVSSRSSTGLKRWRVGPTRGGVVAVVRTVAGVDEHQAVVGLDEQHVADHWRCDVRVHRPAVEVVDLHSSPDPDQRQQFATPDLGHQAGRVEVDAFVDDAVAVEEEHRDDRHPERLTRRRQPVELAEIGSQQVEFDDDRIVGDVEADVVVALVGEGGPGGPVVPHDLVVAVEDLTGGHDLVVRVAR